MSAKCIHMKIKRTQNNGKDGVKTEINQFLGDVEPVVIV